MASSMLEDSQHTTVTQIDEFRETGRLVVHTVGDEAGLMRLDIKSTAFDTLDDVRRHMRLVIPGEVSPLLPSDVFRDNGRFIVTYFSSDIANAGHLPAKAEVTWEIPGQPLHAELIRIESAEQVVRDEGDEAVNIPGGEPNVVYPATVGLMAILALAAGIAASVIVLLLE